MRIRRRVDLVGRVHPLDAERSGGVTHQRDVVAELSGEAAGGLDTGVGHQGGSG